MDYIILFNNKLKAISAPLRFICLLLPSVILVLEMVFLFTGLNVTLRGSHSETK